MAPLAEAFIRVRADTKEVRSDVDKDFDAAGKQAGKKFGDGFTRDAAGRLRNSRGQFVKPLADAGGAAGRESGREFGGALSGTVGAAARSLVGVFAAVGAVSLFRGIIEEAREAEKVTRITEARIKSTGGAARVSADDIGKLAEALSNKVGVDDEVIQSSANLLLTFKAVRNEAGKGNAIFNRAQKAIVDMAAGMNNGEVTASGLKSATVQLGKALQDPVKGITALNKVGIQFTEGQKKQIAEMVKSGNIMGAQKIILREVESQFRGTAAAAADPMQRARIIWDNFKERVGTGLLPVMAFFAGVLVNKVVPALGKAKNFISLVIGAFTGRGAAVTGFSADVTNLATAIGSTLRAAFDFIVPKLQAVGSFVMQNKTFFLTFAGVIGVVVTAVKLWTIAQGLLNIVLTANPVSLVVIAVAGLIALIVAAYKHSTTFRNIVQSAWTGIKTAAMVAWNTVLKPVFNGIKWYIATVLIPYWRLIWQVVQVVWAGIKAAIMVAWNVVIKPIFNAIKFYIVNILIPQWRLIWTVVQLVWSGIKTAISIAWNVVIKPIFTAIRVIISTVLIPIFKFLWSAVKIAWSGIQIAIKVAWAVIKGVWMMIKANLMVLKFAFMVVVAAIKVNWKIMATLIMAVWNGIIKPAWNAIKSALSGPLSAAFRTFKTVATTVWNGVKSVISAVWNSAIKPTFNKLKEGVNAVRSAFRTATSAIGTIWNELRDKTKKPVSFVVNTVYNNGIRRVWNFVAGIAGMKQLQPMKFATGGIIPGGYSRKDNQLIAARSGEGILVPEATQALGGKHFIERANRLKGKAGHALFGGDPSSFRVPGYASGGIVGRIKGLANKGVDLLKGAPKLVMTKGVTAWAKSILDPIVRRSVPGSGSFRDAVAQTPKKMADGLTKWVKDKIAPLLGLGGPGMHRALAWARTQAGKPYRWGGVGPGGYDCSGFMSAIVNVIKGRRPYSRLFTTHSFGTLTGPGGFIRGLPSGMQVGVTDSGVGHMAGTLLKVPVESSGSAGVRVGGGARGAGHPMFSRRYGLRADSGAIIPPKTVLPIYNGTRDAEYAIPRKMLINDLGIRRPGAKQQGLSEEQFQQLVKWVRGGPRGPAVGELHIHGLPTIPSDQQVSSAIDRTLTMRGDW